MALAEWKKQLENNTGIPAMYRKMFPENTEFFDKIIESYIKQIAWIGPSIKENTSGVSEEDIKKATEELSKRPASREKNKE